MRLSPGVTTYTCSAFGGVAVAGASVGVADSAAGVDGGIDVVVADAGERDEVGCAVIVGVTVSVTPASRAIDGVRVVDREAVVCSLAGVSTIASGICGDVNDANNGPIRRLAATTATVRASARTFLGVSIICMSTSFWYKLRRAKLAPSPSRPTHPLYSSIARCAIGNSLYSL